VKYLVPKYEWRSVQDVYSFAKLLSNADPRNTSWAEEDGERFLDAITGTDGYGLARLSEVLQWQSVSCDAICGSTSLSFERGYVPILAYAVSDFVTKSDSKYKGRVKALHLLLRNNWAKIETTLRSNLNAAAERSPDVSASSTGGQADHLEAKSPMSIMGVMRVIVAVLEKCIVQVREDTQAPKLVVFLAFLKECIKKGLLGGGSVITAYHPAWSIHSRLTTMESKLARERGLPMAIF